MSTTPTNPLQSNLAPAEAPNPPSNSSSSSKRPARFKLTQLGNAERLVHDHGSLIRYCPAWKSWLLWDGHRWCVDGTDAIYRKAHSTVRQMSREAKKIQDTGLRAEFEKHAKRSETKYQLDAMVGIAQTLEDVSITPDKLDKDPYLLNCRNGVVDLRTGKLIPHNDSRHYLLTKMAPVRYQPNARCPLWLRFLSRIFDHDQKSIDYVQKIIGYSLTGNVTEKALFLFHGDGNNGKTTFLETIRHMLGDYAGVVEIDALMLGGQDSARERAIADLHGKRFVTASESEAGQRFREATIKKLTGMGRLIGRRLYSNSFEFDPEFKLFLDANYKPQIRGTDEAIWIRIRLIPFKVTIPKGEIDKDLWGKLRLELPGILAWAVQGCLRWQKEGLGSSETVQTANEAYRTEMDIVKMFLTDWCVDDSEAMEGATKLYQAFKQWCADNHEQDVIGQNGFGKRLGEYGYKPHHTSAGNKWKGLRLVQTPDAPTPPQDFRDLDLSQVIIEREPVV